MLFCVQNWHLTGSLFLWITMIRVHIRIFILNSSRQQIDRAPFQKMIFRHFYYIFIRECRYDITSRPKHIYTSVICWYVKWWVLFKQKKWYIYLHLDIGSMLRDVDLIFLYAHRHIYIPVNREWLSGLARCLWSEVVRFDSRNLFEKQLLGSTPTLLTVPHSLAWCARNSGLPPYKQLVPPS